MPRPLNPIYYDMPARNATPEEIANFEAGLPHPSVSAARAARKAVSPRNIVCSLAVGASHLFTQYRRPSQLSAALAWARDTIKGRYASSRELSLIDGECVGVRVTRIE